MKHSHKAVLVTVAIAVNVVATGFAHAHFIWLAPARDAAGNTTLQVYLSEDAAPDDPDLLSRVQGLKVWQLAPGQEPQAVKLQRTDDSLEAHLSSLSAGGSVFVAAHDFGLFQPGDTAFRLKYYAKTGPAIDHAAWSQVDSGAQLRLDIVATLKDGHVHVQVLWDGKPLKGADVKASGPGLDEFEAASDSQGRADFEVAEAGRYSVRARHIEDQGGELDGTKYSATRHYSTLALQVAHPSAGAASLILPDLPQPVTSFGGAILGDTLYMYGGHTGHAHSYSTAEQCNTLFRLQLNAAADWETVATGPRLQGLALVAHDGKLYRLGGFTAKNAEGEEHDLWSQDSVAVFDPEPGKWSDLPPLARTSLFVRCGCLERHDLRDRRLVDARRCRQPLAHHSLEARSVAEFARVGAVAEATVHATRLGRRRASGAVVRDRRNAATGRAPRRAWRCSIRSRVFGRRVPSW